MLFKIERFNWTEEDPIDLFEIPSSTTSSNQKIIKQPSNMEKMAFRKLSEYSQLSEKEIQFNHRGLKTFTIPTINKFDPATGKLKRVLKWNVLKGYQNYTRKTFAPDESRLTTFLATLIHYEFTEKKDTSEYPVIALVSLFRDLALHNVQSYDVVRFEGQWYFSSRDLREKDLLQYAYIGIRFEDMLTQGGDEKPTMNNFAHYKCMTSLRLPGGLNTITISEIDCLEESKARQKFAGFTEVKLCYIESIPSVFPVTDAEDFLDFLDDNKRDFLWVLVKWTIQCIFSNCHNLLIGIRNKDFNIVTMKLFSIKEDILPYLKRVSPDKYYKQVIESPVRVDEMMHRLLRYIDAGDENIYRMDISPAGIKLTEIADEEEQNKIFYSVITQEYVDWKIEGEISEELKNGHYTYRYDPMKIKKALGEDSLNTSMGSLNIRA
ncbi:unnamed protein product [Ambrosiozyma monospora]|uniref:Decapping nuclease n=1 Tax=Ambrosiozyma monospora TaxID=43982 RepID=A0A9W6Z3U3_AMBMO|nr:unnamed protein product [Ambrosiozyma monospora]